MATLTLVQDYVLAATRHAIFERLDEQTVAATVPGFLGIVAYGDDVQECWNNLYEQLERWVQTSSERGYVLPIINGIDLNKERGDILASCHQGAPTSAQGDLYENEDEFFAALDGHGTRPG